MRQWNPVTAELRSAFEDHKDAVTSVCTIRGMLVTGCDDGLVRVHWADHTIGGREMVALQVLVHDGDANVMLLLRRG